MKKSTNNWYQNSKLRFSKIRLKIEEKDWLESFAPDARIERIFLESAKHMFSFKSGLWDGHTTMVTFDDPDQAMLFKLTWWN